MKMEQTQIAEKLGMSHTQFKRMIDRTALPWVIIDKKRHYELDDVLKLLQDSAKEAK